MSKKAIVPLTEKLSIPAPTLTPDELAKKIYAVAKNEKIFGCHKFENDKVENLKRYKSVLALLLQDNLHPEIVDLFLEHSMQNGFAEAGIDLNASKIRGSGDENFINYAILGCNYEHFRKLIELNVNYLNGIKSISSWPGEFMNKREYTQEDRENRRKMLRDLLALGAQVTEEVINSFTMDAEVDFFEIAAESESGKKLLTPNFLEKLAESCKTRQKNKDDNSMLTAIIKLHKRKKVEEILKQNTTKEGMKEILLVTEGEVKKKALSIINSPGFKAQIVEYLLHYYGDELALQIADGLRKKLLEDPKKILDLLLPKP